MCWLSNGGRFEGYTLVLCSERALTLYILGISLGGGQDIYTEQVVDSVAEGRELSGLSRGLL